MPGTGICWPVLRHDSQQLRADARRRSRIAVFLATRESTTGNMLWLTRPVGLQQVEESFGIADAREIVEQDIGGLATVHEIAQPT